MIAFGLKALIIYRVLPRYSSSLLAFANFFTKEHALPKHARFAFDGVFNDPRVQECFEVICSCFNEFVHGIDAEAQMLSCSLMLSSSLSLVNVFDVGISRATYEFLMAVGGRRKNLILVNVLDLDQLDRETVTNLLYLMDPKYNGRYSKSMQVSFYKHRSILHNTVSNMEAASLSKPQVLDNTIIVATHADKFVDESKRTEREREVKDLLTEYFTDMGNKYENLLSKMVCVDATDTESCKKVRDTLCMLIDEKNFQVNLPLRYLFLLYVLHSTRKVYMSRKEVVDYAQKCGMEEFDVGEFISIFTKCLSIICYDKSNSHIILCPTNFRSDLDKLYSIQENALLRRRSLLVLEYCPRVF